MSASATTLLQDTYLRRAGDHPCRFRYTHPDGTPYTDEAGLARIAKLAIPPGYQDVYVSPDADADLQAFGRDAAGRLQYRYHADFLQARAGRKWARLGRFARALPAFRTATTTDLRRTGLPERKVLAIMTRVLHVARFRVGSEAYARAHRTYGLSTLLKRHVRVDGTTVEFNFKGKHGVQQHRFITDRTVASAVERLLELPGPHLFQAVQADGTPCRIHAPEVNAYLRDVMGPFTAKDFRTWGGTLLAAEYLAELGAPATERDARKGIVECVKAVAEDLGNTPAVVRAHYVCPVIFDRYAEGRVLDDFEPRANRLPTSLEGLTRAEAALARLLASRPRKGE
ncbi:DNA topoisomerase IB [Deinococcus maricopensis]|uniref:DNA topoisomerase n=1 Tax=Deinococcus maricopensis (strain DSM 21211 / LMG 22137 / NRRL B-23946 / LB-34) TaxID=709986 RepID=E8U6Z2_DEIML|nr:DNA topoisomerase IB [Deinococcus maricopensis]ADV66831.1 DNA topoisomerase [Deinococcus maricopensis DSM 21211]